MKISKRVQYGIIAIVSIAIHSQNGSYVNVLNIAKQNNLPIRYLENIMSDLRRNNLVIGKRGCINGGYKLKKNPNDITLTKILNALDNNILNQKILEFTDSVTISMMMNL